MLWYNCRVKDKESWGIKLIYLDNSATTKQHEQVTAEMLRTMEQDFGNPSSLHRLGLSAEKLVKKARKEVAESLGSLEEEIFFTSGGTESDNMAILGAAYSRRRSGNKIITTKIEHPAVLESCKRLEREGYKVVYLDVDANGILSLDQLKSEMDASTICLSVMHVNNEVGSIQPLEEVIRIKNNFNATYNKDILLHVDAVQSYGKLNIRNLGADLISISGHKVHGPKGIGALYVRKGVLLDPILLGGGQERGQRSGTENVPGIVGLGVAANRIGTGQPEIFQHLTKLKEYFLSRIQSEIPDVKMNGDVQDAGSPGILNVSFLGIRGEVLLHSLEQEEIYVSTGSACASNKKGQSHVLKAMGLRDQEIEGAIRFSFCEGNTMEEMDQTMEKLVPIINKMRSLKKFR